MLCKIEHGLPNTLSVAAKPYVLDGGRVAVPKPDAGATHLTRVHSVCANALLPDQSLEIRTGGLTVVYGENGTGKSGYVRVLKQVCRARGGADRVLPNVYLHEVLPTSATICYRVSVPDADAADHGDGGALPGAGDLEVRWTPGMASPAVLQEVSVFDSRSAAVYVNERNEAAYLPYGTDIFPRLAAVADAVGERLAEEVAALDAVRDQFETIPRDTKVGEVVDNLHLADARARAVALATLTPDEQESYDELRAEVAQWKANDPALRATELRQRATRFRGAQKRLAIADDALSGDRVAALIAASTARDTARETHRLVSAAVSAAAPIAGVGSETWRALWTAARRFASEGATPPRDFPPPTEPRGLCVLCQQDLDDVAQTRLAQFEEFVASDAARMLERATDALRALVSSVETTNPASIADEVLVAEIAGVNSDAAETLVADMAELVGRRSALLGAAGGTPTSEWPSGVLKLSPSASLLQGLAETLEADAHRFDASRDATVLDAQGRALHEWDARVALSKIVPRIEAEIERSVVRAKLKACLQTVGTTGITKHGTILLREAVSEPLAARFRAEMTALRLTHLPVAVSPASGQKGRALHGIELAKRASEKAATSAIISEGEYRGVALAAFLAEIELQDSTSTVVFDDPVSSIDHGRREYVATRIAEIATRRPVLVFTHDIPFLWMLANTARSATVAMDCVQFHRVAAGAGWITSDVPWDAHDVKERIGQLRQRAQKLKKLADTNPVEYATEVRSIYGRLRTTWERAIEEVLFNGALRRFQQEIKTMSLKHLHLVTEKQVQECSEGMTRTSDWIDAHDHATELALTIPLPDEVERDVQALVDWHKGMVATHQGKAVVTVGQRQA